MKAVDKASGYIFGTGDDATMAMMSSAMGADFDFFKYPFYCVVFVIVYDPSDVNGSLTSCMQNIFHQGTISFGQSIIYCSFLFIQSRDCL